MQQDSPADVSIAVQLGLTEEEYERIVTLIGRQPNFVELSMFSVMWSEHCSYKNSIKYLRTLPRSGPALLVEAGAENAGLVDIGDNLACAFKIESHNHPSYIEPYHGAATGVGGIHRDIFSMGARPIAALDSLRFGDLDFPIMKRLVRGVVKGIGDYGNCLGVPTVAGETYFHPCYNYNILVNAMSVGIVEKDKTASATAGGPGNVVYIVGAATGKDGIHGATFASADLDEDSHEDLPSVQIGDPFMEKLLLEATLEAIRTGAVVGIQDMGAAGITCCASEMSAKASTGMHLNLDAVPLRQQSMEAWEILLSESQERMMFVLDPNREEEVLRIFDKWNLLWAKIGYTDDSGMLKIDHRGQRVAEIPANALVVGGGAPVYDRPYQRPRYMDAIESFSERDIPDVGGTEEVEVVLEQLLSHPTIASKRWITEQYDFMVRTNTVYPPDHYDAALVRIKGTRRALAVTTDCNASFVFADPYRGAMMAVAEAARNISCSGGTPLAITNCLNFGNPYNPEVYYQFVHAVRGMGDACRAFQTPVTGGNVSFYNQSEIQGQTIPIYPTPTIGMIGIVEDMDYATSLAFRQPGDLIYLLGSSCRVIGCSVYLHHYRGVEYSPCPPFDIEDELKLQHTLRRLIRQRCIQSAHDIAEGGLLVALIESALPRQLGFEVVVPHDSRLDAALFGEAPTRVIIGVDPAHRLSVESELSKAQVPYTLLGRVTSGSISLNSDPLKDITHWSGIYHNALSDALGN